MFTSKIIQASETYEVHLNIFYCQYRISLQNCPKLQILGYTVLDIYSYKRSFSKEIHNKMSNKQYKKLAYCILSFYFCINSANKQSNNKFNLQATITQ